MSDLSNKLHLKISTHLLETQIRTLMFMKGQELEMKFRWEFDKTDKAFSQMISSNICKCKTKTDFQLIDFNRDQTLVQEVVEDQELIKVNKLLTLGESSVNFQMMTNKKIIIEEVSHHLNTVADISTIP